MGSSIGTQPSLPEVDLRQKTVVVTGANTGIGYETAKRLAQDGAKVIIACRSEHKATEAIEQMKEEHAAMKAGGERTKRNVLADDLDVEFMTLDLGSLTSTKAFVETCTARGIVPQVLVCNAGVICAHDDLTSDGFEVHFQVNYLAHLLLVLLFLPVLKASGHESRIVLVSSLAYRFATWDEADLQCLHNADKTRRYSNSKLYQIMQMFSLARRLEGSGVSVFSVHPGVVNTDLFSREPDGQEMPRMTKFFVRMAEVTGILRQPVHGALTSLHAAANPKYDGKTALYFESCQPHSLTSTPRDRWKQEILWKYSLECLKDYITDDVMDTMR